MPIEPQPPTEAQRAAQHLVDYLLAMMHSFPGWKVEERLEIFENYVETVVFDFCADARPDEATIHELIASFAKVEEADRTLLQKVTSVLERSLKALEGFNRSVTPFVHAYYPFRRHPPPVAASPPREAWHVLRLELDTAVKRINKMAAEYQHCAALDVGLIQGDRMFALAPYSVLGKTEIFERVTNLHAVRLTRDWLHQKVYLMWNDAGGPLLCMCFGLSPIGRLGIWRGDVFALSTDLVEILRIQDPYPPRSIDWAAVGELMGEITAVEFLGDVVEFRLPALAFKFRLPTVKQPRFFALVARNRRLARKSIDAQLVSIADELETWCATHQLHFARGPNTMAIGHTLRVEVEADLQYTVGFGDRWTARSRITLCAEDPDGRVISSFRNEMMYYCAALLSSQVPAPYGKTHEGQQEIMQIREVI